MNYGFGRNTAIITASRIIIIESPLDFNGNEFFLVKTFFSLENNPDCRIWSSLSLPALAL